LSTTPSYDIIGQRFDRWLVVSFSHMRTRRAQWNCVCDCGTKKIVCGDSLRLGRSRSCGCYMREATAAMAKRLFTTHGHTTNYRTSREYWVWAGMIQRCTNPNHVGFHNYGGRGIRVCDRWKNSFADFIADMGPRPTPQHTIERVDNNGNYEPTNCKWTTRAEQSRNTRRNKNAVRYQNP
jgi:hypothetical protein